MKNGDKWVNDLETVEEIREIRWVGRKKKSAGKWRQKKQNNLAKRQNGQVKMKGRYVQTCSTCTHGDIS